MFVFAFFFNDTMHNMPLNILSRSLLYFTKERCSHTKISFLNFFLISFNAKSLHIFLKHSFLAKTLKWGRNTWKGTHARNTSTFYILLDASKRAFGLAKSLWRKLSLECFKISCTPLKLEKENSTKHTKANTFISMHIK